MPAATATHVVPQSQAPGRLHLAVRNAPAAVPTGIRLLSLRERILNSIFCRNHDWTRAFTLNYIDYAGALKRTPEDPDSPFDSHQCCIRCGVHRLFDSQHIAGGPLFLEVFGR